MGSVLDRDWFPRPLPANVHVDETAWLYSSFAFLHFAARRPDAVVIGAHTGVYNGCHFELGPDASVAIGRYCSIVGAIINTNGNVRIDDHVFIAHEVVIADSVHAVPLLPERASETESRREPGRRIHVAENVWIGARAIVVGHVRIGENAIIGAGCVVTTDIPRNAIAAGNPARVVGSVNRGRHSSGGSSCASS